MGSVWHWVVTQWSTAVISSLFGFGAGLIGAAFRWRWPSYKELREERQAKRDKETDMRVLAYLDGIGSSIAVAGQIAEAAGLGIETVNGSLDRLEGRGRVVNAGRTMDTDTGWFSLHR
jgi:hypothetical protein